MSVPSSTLLSTFDVYDLNKAGKIPVGDAASVLRSCGFYGTREEMGKLLGNFVSATPPEVTREQFAELIKTLPGDSFKATTTDLCVALQAFDYHEDGTLTSDELMNIFLRMPDHITSDEYARVMHGAPLDGKADIPSLATFLMRMEKEYKVTSKEILEQLHATPEV